MPYHVSVTTIASQQRYRVLVVDELDGTTARHLGDWLDAARLNPGARFEIDLSEARWVDDRALRNLITRHRTLVSDERLDLIEETPPATSRLAALSMSAMLALEPLAAGCF
jgi:hypothetical protein